MGGALELLENLKLAEIFVLILISSLVQTVDEHKIVKSLTFTESVLNLKKVFKFSDNC